MEQQRVTVRRRENSTEEFATVDTVGDPETQQSSPVTHVFVITYICFKALEKYNKYFKHRFFHLILAAIANGTIVLNQYDAA